MHLVTRKNSTTGKMTSKILRCRDFFLTAGESTQKVKLRVAPWCQTGPGGKVFKDAVREFNRRNKKLDYYKKLRRQQVNLDKKKGLYIELCHYFKGYSETGKPPLRAKKELQKRMEGESGSSPKILRQNLEEFQKRMLTTNLTFHALKWSS